MVASPRSSPARHLFGPSQPSPRLLVRRLRREVGSSSPGRNRFRLVVSGGVFVVDQRKGASCGGVRIAPLPTSSVQLHGSSFLRQLHSSGVSTQAGGHTIDCPQLHLSEDLPLGGDDRSSPGPSIHLGQERVSGFPVSSEPGPGVRMDAEVGGVSSVEQQVASDDRPFCHLIESPLFTLFFALPRSIINRYGCASSELRRVSSVCLSTLVSDTASSEEAPLIIWDPHDSHCSVLAPETMVPGPSRPSGGRFHQSSKLSRSPKTTTLSLPSSRDRQAVPSCLETIQRFPGSQGFSSRVAKQLGFARRSSSRAVYQSKWLVYRSWCRSKDHSISRLTLSEIADILLWLKPVRKLSVSAIMGCRSMLSAVFRFKLPEISTSLVLNDLLWSF